MKDSEILIIGSKGQLGTALQARYPGAKAVDSDILDITDPSAVNAFNWAGIKYIFNAAAYTNVDGAETEEGKKIAWEVNADGVKNLAEVAKEKDIVLVHISTEYVFDGTHDNHPEDEEPSPLSQYGKSKYAGDKFASEVPKHYLLRTSWVIGAGKNFVRTMLELGVKGIAPKVVGDQIGRLTFTHVLVDAIDHLINSNASFGTYNVSNSGDPASWADVTREIFKIAGHELKVSGISTAEYFADKPEAAKRPLKSTLDLSKIEATGFNSPDWRQDLVEYIEKENQ